MKSSQILKRVVGRISAYKFSFIFSLIFSAVTVAGTLYIPVLAGEGIDCIVGKGRVDFDRLTVVLIRILIALAVSGVCQYFANLLNNRLSFLTVRDMRNEAFENLQNVPISYIDSKETGDLVSRMIADADQLADGLLMGFQSLFTGILTIFGTLFFMFSINVWIGLLVFVLTPLSLFVSRFISRKTFNFFAKQSEQRGEETAFAEEILSNLKTVKAYHREAENQRIFDEINDKLGSDSLKATFYSSLTNPATRFINSVVYAAVGLSGAICALNGIITVGNLSAFLAYANQYTKPFNEITGVFTELQNAIACAGRLFELIDAEAEYEPDAVLPDHAEGSFTAENVAFSYDKSRELLKDLNFELESGQKLAVVGPTGCGKTTLINLLMRFYDIDSGAIRLDGIDINTVTRHSLRSQMGMVLQETWLKSGTIRENIAFGAENVTDEQIIEAAKKSHAHSFIKKLSDGYDTVLGEDGGSLSIGQKQLICITRLMLNPPPVLILDEATSSIDLVTEQRITRSFMKLMQGRTAFVVAHRLSTIQNSDIILVMKDGQVVEVGNHRQLLTANGFYSSLYASQFD